MRSLALISFALLGCTLVGCSSGPQLGQVEGTVTLNGEPLADAKVAFVPQEGGRTAEAVTDDAGHYELEFAAGAKGAVLGPHLVRISTFEEAVSGDDGKMTGGRKELVPAEFNTASKEIRDVKSGEQTFDFTITN